MEIEYLPIEEIKKRQELLLRQQLNYLEEKSPFYRSLFRQHNISLDKKLYLDDLNKIPFTTKEDLQSHHAQFICVDKSEIVDYCATSGTQGEPVIIPQTEKDLQRLAYNEFKSLSCAGGTKYDVFQLTTTINKQFMAGLAYFMGVRKMGAGIIRVGSGAIPLQWQNILSLNPTFVIAVPSFLLKMIDYADEHGINYRDSSVKSAVCIGEPIRQQDFRLNSLGRRIKDRWDIEIFSTYASSEMATAFTECRSGQGGHHQPDLIIAEIVDEDGNSLPEGELGELVITTLGIEAFPLLRYKTGDICRKHIEKCGCGRTSFRLGPVLGRKNQMIKYKGTTLFPSSIIDVMNGIPGVRAFHIQLLSDEFGNDDLLVNIAKLSEMEIEKLKKELQGKLRVTPQIKIRSEQEINSLIYREGFRKAIYFSDCRKQEI